MLYESGNTLVFPLFFLKFYLMKIFTLVFFSTCSVVFLFGQSFTKSFYLPDTLSSSFIEINIKDTTHEFVTGVSSPSFGYNSSYLGPTLILKKNELFSFDIQNNLMMSTTVHWHGMHVPSEMDGGPHTVIGPGASWQPSFVVKDEASTMWYHSHLHHHTLKQVTKGLAGLIIIRDDHEASLNLPRTYGEDDFPIIIQDRQFASGVVIDSAIMGDSIMVNGVIHPFIDLPANFVRFRLLNGSNHRVYNIGFSDNINFQIIAGDGGLLDDAVSLNRILLSPGERYEILLDLSTYQDSSLFMYTYASEMILGYPGGPFAIPDDNVQSAINGLDLGIMKLQVGSANSNGILSPDLQGLNVNEILDSTLVDRKRSKDMNATLIKGEMVWTIDNEAFDLEVINDTILLNSTELWTITNSSGIVHPFHIHSGYFYILSRGGQMPQAYERGKKDVAIIYPGQSLKFIMKFEDFVDENVPYMYHCHILNHEDHAMMAQFIVVDSSYFSGIEQLYDDVLVVGPNPVQNFLNIHLKGNEKITKLVLLNPLGQIILKEDHFGTESSIQLDLNLLTKKGNYFLSVESKRGARIVKVEKL